MRAIRAWVTGCALALAAGGPISALGADKAGEKKEAPKDLILKGDAKCTQCHDEADAPEQLAIGKTRHGVTADSRNPTCTSCHGESEKHIKEAGRGNKQAPFVDVGYTKKNPASAETRNAACLTCHQGGKRIHWQSNAHATREVACSSCHKIHTAHDPVRNKLSQSEVCFGCHKEQRAQMNRPSRHPIREGKVACSDCHNGHGTAGVKMLVRDSVNDTCYSCHMEKRGPFVRTHQPVQEDCSICHNPHGSTISNLLKTRSPYLCQQCHEPTSHRGNEGDLQVTLGSTGTNAKARGCLNCHTNIHGTNNPENVSNERTFRR